MEWSKARIRTSRLRVNYDAIDVPMICSEDPRIIISFRLDTCPTIQTVYDLNFNLPDLNIPVFVALILISHFPMAYKCSLMVSPQKQNAPGTSRTYTCLYQGYMPPISEWYVLFNVLKFSRHFEKLPLARPCDKNGDFLNKARYLHHCLTSMLRYHRTPGSRPSRISDFDF